MSPYNTYDDSSLLSLLKRSDDKAFTEIYYRYWEKIFAIAYNLTRSEFDAMEMVQNLFTGIWERRTTFNAEKLENYLATAVKFSFYRELERTRRKKEIEAGLYEYFDEAAMDEEIESRFTEEYLRGQIERLPEKCRLVFTCSRVYQMTNEEIANHLSISEKTVEGHMTKGLKLLRLYIRESGLLSLLGVSLHQLLQ